MEIKERNIYYTNA